MHLENGVNESLIIIENYLKQNELWLQF
jgi:hypothetical protein